MKNITHVSGFARTSTLAVLGLITSLGLASQVLAYAPITTTLDFGETNSDVSNLQTFFKDNSAIYPEGLVTGYFGGLTRTAVQQFQTSQNIVSGGSAATTGYGFFCCGLSPRQPPTGSPANPGSQTAGWPRVGSAANRAAFDGTRTTAAGPAMGAG